MIPSPWVSVVLLLAIFRIVRLAGWDNFPPVVLLRGRLTGAQVRTSSVEGGRVVAHRRPLLSHYLGCAYCSGFWTSVLVYAVWVAAGSPGAIAADSWVFYPLVPFAFSAGVGIVARMLDPD